MPLAVRRDGFGSVAALVSCPGISAAPDLRAKCAVRIALSEVLARPSGSPCFFLLFFLFLFFFFFSGVVKVRN